jgi:hypothetical protein
MPGIRSGRNGAGREGGSTRSAIITNPAEIIQLTTGSSSIRLLQANKCGKVRSRLGASLNKIIWKLEIDGIDPTFKDYAKTGLNGHDNSRS